VKYVDADDEVNEVTGPPPQPKRNNFKSVEQPLTEQKPVKIKRKDDDLSVSTSLQRLIDPNQIRIIN
jgi:hypothetical protein